MKALVTATVIVALALGALLGGVARESRSATPAAPAPVQAEALRSGFAPGDTQALLLRLQADVAARPDDAHSVALLGLAYAQRARETGDAAYVSRADRALRRAVRLEPEDFEALTGLGGVALTRHRFRDALALGRRAIAAAPGTAAPYGVLGDALLELGRYDAAFATFDRMAALKPNTSSYARVSYARELRGDVAAAIDAMELALDAAAGRPEAYAWTSVELGKLHWSVGRAQRAASFYRLALAARPGFAPALDALARFEAAQGRLGRAVALQRRAVDAVPLPGYVAQLGDLLGANGRKREARAAVRPRCRDREDPGGERLEDRPRVRALPHRPRDPPRETLELARLAHVRRPSVAGDDVLAWALARNGRCGEARRWSQRSLPARDARCLVLLPPRDDRALPRPGRRRAALVPARARHEPALLAPLEPDRTEVRPVKRLLVTLAVLAALAAPASALAHPLGNFTVNRQTEIELSGGRVYVHYALDLAEIPTFQLGTRVRGAGFAREAARGLELRLDGRRAPLRLLERRVSERPGAGGLKTLRFDAVYAAAGSGSPARVPRPQLPLADRLAGSRRPRGGGSLATVGERAGRESQQRPARVPERPAPLAARRHLGHRVLHARRRSPAPPPATSR